MADCQEEVHSSLLIICWESNSEEAYFARRDDYVFP